MHPKLLDAYNKHAAATFDKQCQLEDLVADQDGWEFDMDTGLLSFSNNLKLNVQILGSQSEVSDTWLWSWGNEASSIPDKLQQSARSLHKLGEKNGLHELSEAQLPTDVYDGHFWSILATGICKANAYFRGPYESGAAFFLINDPIFSREVKDPLIRLSTIFPRAISEYSISDHKRALIGHAEFLGLTIHKRDDNLLIQDKQGNQLTATFDELNRLTCISGEVTEITDLNVTESTSAPVSLNPQGKEKVTFFQGWYRNFRKHYKQAIPFYSAIGIVFGLIAWPFTSIKTAGIVAFISFFALIFRGLIETDR